MLRAIAICPDNDLNDGLERALRQIGVVAVSRVLDHYPDSKELPRCLRAHAPQIIFLSVESMPRAAEIVREIEKNSPGAQILAVGRACDPQVLMELMRTGIREYAAFPFDIAAMTAALSRLRDLLTHKPAFIESTESVFAFLPAKAGVGASTIAMNAAVALSRQPDSSVLLADFDLNSGMVRFMLKLENGFSVTDAAEHAFHMDEDLWPQMVTSLDALDVLHAGKLNPDLRIEAAQINRLIEFMRRNYRVVCFDLSGNLEKYSLEIMHESKNIFLVCTPELPSLYLAREKYFYLKQLDLHERVRVLVNRCQKRALVSPQQIEELLGVPVAMSFPNDYQGVHKALTRGRSVEPAGALGKQFTLLSQTMLENRPFAVDTRKKFIEFFAVPAKHGQLEANKTAV